MDEVEIDARELLAGGSHVTITHEVAFSSYLELAFLVVCVAISLYAFLRTRKNSFLVYFIGFAMLVLKYGLSIALISYQDQFTDSLSLLNNLISFIGTAGLALFALGIFLESSYVTKNSSAGSLSSD